MTTTPLANVVPISLPQRLPFTISIAADEQEIQDAVHIRHAAYARHVPGLAALLSEPEAGDRATGAVVLLARSKLDHEPLGTMRIQTNAHRALALEQSIALPPRLRQGHLAEATRLGVCQSRIGRVVKTLLFKAFYLYCRRVGVDWMVIGARSPLDRQYEALGFDDVFPGRGYVPLAHAGNIPHRVLGFEMAGAEARWRQAQHPLYALFCRTQHPDIDLRGAAPVTTPRPQEVAAPVRIAAEA